MKAAPDVSRPVQAARPLANAPANCPTKPGKRHIEGRIQIACLWTRVVFEHFHGDRGVVGDDHTRLNHTQQTGDAFCLAESAGGINHSVSIVASVMSFSSGLVLISPAAPSMRRPTR